MTREEFRAWVATQPRGRYERVDGYVVVMSAERTRHAMVKARVFQEFDRALVEAGSNCVAMPDGMTVEVDPETDYQPDTVVSCGGALDMDALNAAAPIIVVEVTSPGTRGVDTGAKLSGYLRVPSIHHYLIVSATRREVVHNRRSGNGFDVRVLTGGPLVLDPPGITVNIGNFYARLPL
jgi:Uma2 family endonuclease